MREVLAQQIIDSCLEMVRLGLNQGASGNASVRFEEGMLITPTGIEYSQMTPEQIVYVDGSGHFEEGKKPSSEWQFHLACYKSRQDCNAVVHNHAINSTTLAILEKPIPAIHYMIAASGCKTIPLVPYATFGSQELSDSVAKGITTSKALLLAHHGSIAIGENLNKAMWLSQEVETLADMYIKALSTGLDIKILDDEEMDKVIEKFKTYGLKVEE
ncbi:L-fuculose phosphate aldolase [Vibrio marisflavi CECT 7928]|uniref:L-fuculose phosphate aldolase n=2 Tax=Vibrio marisflavi TaxID=1216040 RepID=A0ABN8E8A9_9VIBR|nr:L-fuculose phosphate aldolase [Vibrio marisflavi CECT 7928]